MKNSENVRLQAYTANSEPLEREFPLAEAPIFTLDQTVFRVPHSAANKALIYSPKYSSYALVDIEVFNLMKNFNGEESFGEIIETNFHISALDECLAKLHSLGLIETGPGSQKRAEQRLKNKPSHLPTLVLALTSDCNLGCVYCYASAHDNPKNMIQQDYVEAIDYFVMQWFGKCTRAELLLHGGGEPTLNPRRFREVISLFYKKCKSFHIEPSIGIETNGCFAPSVLETIVEFDVSVGVSMDGLAEIHNAQRPFLNGKGSFERIEKNIKALSDRGVEVGIVSVVTEKSLNSMLDFVRWSASIGVTGINFEPVEGVGRADKNGIVPPYMPDYSRIFTDCFILGAELGMTIRTGVDIFGPAKMKFCGAAGNNTLFTPEGHISTCVEVLDLENDAAEEFIIGHYDSETKKVEIWDEKLQKLKGRYVDTIPQCHSCFIKYSCGGGCPVHNKATTGDINIQKIDWCESMRSLSSTTLSSVFDLELYKKMPSAYSTEVVSLTPTRNNLICTSSQFAEAGNTY